MAEYERDQVDRVPIVLHVIYRLGTGGLENGLVNLINHTPLDRYRHVIVSLTDATDFQERIQRQDVPVFSLHKRKGQDFGSYGRLRRIVTKFKSGYCPYS